MGRDVLQIKITPRKQPKTKFGRWWRNKITDPLHTHKLQFKAWFWGGMYRAVLKLGKWIVPNHMHEEIFGDDEFYMTLDVDSEMDIDPEIEKQLKEVIHKSIKNHKLEL